MNTEQRTMQFEIRPDAPFMSDPAVEKFVDELRLRLPLVVWVNLEPVSEFGNTLVDCRCASAWLLTPESRIAIRDATGFDGALVCLCHGGLIE